MNVPFLDLSAACSELREELDSAYRKFMDSGWYVLGEEVSSFETEYAAYCEARHCVGVGTGLDALVLALRALDIGPGDEVIVPSNTYIATWLAITQVGATIVPVEPDAGTFNIGPAAIEAAISDQTRVILPVNLYGQPVDYDEIMAIGRRARCKVVIDNAQAQGARYRGRRVGGIADIECHSFYPTKNLGAFGEAGAVTTNDGGIAARISRLRNYGSRVRYYHEECGTNSRLDAIQAAFLRVKLRRLDEWNQRRRGIADLYQKAFRANPGTFRQIQNPQVPDWADPVWHLFVIRSGDRDALQNSLERAGIGTLIHYPVPPGSSEAYRNSRPVGENLPVAQQLASEVLSLPMGPHLSSESAMHVMDALHAAVRDLHVRS